MSIVKKNIKPDKVHDRQHGHPRAIDLGYSLCKTCDHPVHEDNEFCLVCDSKVEQRSTMELQKAWAWLIVSAMFYPAAMIFPVSTIIFLGASSPSTLLESVSLFWNHGAWHVAIVIFVASVFIPGFKILSVAYILVKISYRRNSVKQCQQVTSLYRFVEFIGRWSMIDVFVVALLVALVKFGGLATMLPGLGIFCFSIVVIASIMAAHHIDIRLLWDEKQKQK